MKLKNNLIRSITSVCAALIILVSSFCVPVLAADANGNEWVNFNDYAKFKSSEDGNLVIANVSFPSSWCRTNIRSLTSDIGDQWFTGNEFTVFGDSYTTCSLRMYPISGDLNYNVAQGSTVEDSRIIDLRYFPSGTQFSYTFSMTASTYALNFDDQNIFRSFFFVDSSGYIFKESRYYFRPTFDSRNSVYSWSETISLDSFPEDAVGFIPHFWVSNLEYAFDTLTVALSPFQFTIPMSAAELDAIQNQQLNETMKNIDKAIGDAVTGTPEQNQQANDAVNGLNNSTDKLGELGDQMASVEKPSIDSNKISADSLVPHTSLVALSMPFQALWENKQLLAMLSIVVTLVLVSWVFFGKKG